MSALAYCSPSISLTGPLMNSSNVCSNSLLSNSTKYFSIQLLIRLKTLCQMWVWYGIVQLDLVTLTSRVSVSQYEFRQVDRRSNLFLQVWCSSVQSTCTVILLRSGSSCSSVRTHHALWDLYKTIITDTCKHDILTIKSVASNVADQFVNARNTDLWHRIARRWALRFCNEIWGWSGFSHWCWGRCLTGFWFNVWHAHTENVLKDC